jgi:WS/DGAT/MGAT family acyltransferase
MGRTAAKPLSWGSATTMNPLETLFWRAEADPRLRSTIVALEVLDCAPDWDRLVRAHEWGTRMIPRFRRRVVEAPLGLASPAWVADPNFDLAYHVRRVQVPEGDRWANLFVIAEQLAMAPFDRRRPPWEALLVEGLPDGRAAYLLKLHHSATDGIGGLQLFGLLHARARVGRGRKQAPRPPRESRSGVELIAGQAWRDARSVPGALRKLASGAAHPDELARYAASLRRVLATDAGAPSPLLRERSPSWRFLALEVDFGDLRAAARSVGGTLNDAYLAALLGAFRRYHEALDRPIETMPIAIPISVRQDGAEAGGNHFAPARMAGPVGVADAAERMRQVGAAVRAARAEAALDGLALLAPLLSRLPTPLVTQLAAAMAAGNDLQASNVRGLREDVYLAGAKVERLYPFAPLPGGAAMITLVTHGEVACIGATIDPAAITEIELFKRCLVEGFDEVLALHRGAAGAVLRT